MCFKFFWSFEPDYFDSIFKLIFIVASDGVTILLNEISLSNRIAEIFNENIQKLWEIEKFMSENEIRLYFVNISQTIFVFW